MLCFLVMGVFLLAIWMVGKFEKPISMTITKVEKKVKKMKKTIEEEDENDLP